jgi:protein-S-isoprenylcysteine O-methyltransferase Ste14
MKNALVLMAMAILFLLGSSVAEPSGIVERISIPWWEIGIIALAVFILVFYCSCILAGRADDHKQKLIGRALK